MSDAVAPATREIRSVLHPTDLTEASQVAFAHALRMALSARTKLYLLHADPKETEEPDWSSFPAVRQTLERWGMLAQGSTHREVLDRLGIQLAKIRVHDSDAVRAILRFLGDHPSDLIVLATHGRAGLPRWLHGSVAEPVARAAFVNTLFIPHGARGFVTPESGAVTLRRVLIPIDRRPSPALALRAAWQITRLVGAEGVALQLLHVGAAAEMPIVQVEPDPWSAVERSTRAGDVVEQILAAANEGEADLIVMATEGHQGFLDALRGSTTERVLRHAPCAVLAVPAM